MTKPKGPPRYDYPSWVDDKMPFIGACAFCGSNDKRHRVIEAMTGHVRAGDSEESTGEDYGYSADFVRRLVKAGF